MARNAPSIGLRWAAALLFAATLAACEPEAADDDVVYPPQVEVAGLTRGPGGVSARLVVRNANDVEARVIRAVVELGAGARVAVEPDLVLAPAERTRCLNAGYEDGCQEVGDDLCCGQPQVCEPLVDGCRLRILIGAQCVVCPGSSEVTLLAADAPGDAAALDVVGTVEIAVGGATIEGSVSVDSVPVEGP